MKMKTWRRGCLLLLDLAILLSVLFVFEYFWLDLPNFDIHVPLLYDGDGLTTLSGVKTFLTSGAFHNSSLLGAPSTAPTGSSLASGTNNIGILGNAFWSLFTNDPTVLLNLRVICIPILNTLIAFFVLRSLKLNHLVSCAGAFAFGTCYFVRTRMGHIGLMFCGVIPLAILLCIWCLEDERLLRFRTLLTYKRNWLVILFSILIANSGISYYAFFACFFLGITLLYQLMNPSRRKNLLSTFLAIGLICFFFLLNFLPSMLGMEQSESATMLRNIAGSEIYGMRISGLFVSPRGLGIPILQRLYNVYKAEAVLFNENSTGYLGIFAILGCFMLLLMMFSERGRNDRLERSYMPLLSRMLIFAMLFATIAGFSNLFALLVTKLLRGYNRITVYLTFICILAVCYAAHSLMEHPTRWIRLSTVAAVVIISLLTWYDLGFSKAVNIAGNTYAYTSDQRFIHQIDDLLEDDAMVFQLPYATYPEQGNINNMPDYAHLVGYIHSDNLRWSYGSGRGSFNDEWYKAVAARPLPEMIEQLCYADFSGIYIDTRGYDAATVESMTTELIALTRAEPLTDDRKLFLFFPLESVKDAYTTALTPEVRARLQQYALQGDSFFQYNSGTYPLEKNPAGNFRWMKNTASISLYNMSNLSEYELTLKLAAGVGEGMLTISCNGVQETLALTVTPQEFKVTLPMVPGKNQISLAYNGQQVTAPTDTRAMFYRLIEFDSLNALPTYQDQLQALIE